MSIDDVVIFAEHCPNHGARAMDYWVEPTGEGYELGFSVVVRYKCKERCLDSKSAAREPREVRDFAGHRIPKTTPATRR
jgi:hypothetical protein